MKNQDRKPKSSGFVRKAVLAAALISLLAVTASAAGLGGWFAQLFAKPGQPLTDSQIQYLDNQEQVIQDAQTQNGWTIELRSAINDGSVGYVILGVTAPEDISLEAVMENGTVISNAEPGNLAYTPDNDIPELITWPDGVTPLASTFRWVDDGDGKANTWNYVIQVTPSADSNSIAPFGTEAQWRICVADMIRESWNEEYYQELMNGKYKGQTDVMFTGEETAKLHSREVLVEGTWEFAITFADSQEGVALVSEPVQVLTQVLNYTGEKMRMLNR